MIRLADGPRHALAGLVGAGAFLLAFFGGTMTWWISLALALSIYVAVLLIVARRRPLGEIQLSGRVTAADIAQAVAALDTAAGRLEAAASDAPDSDAETIRAMAGHVGSIRRSLAEDPEDYRPTRRFVGVFLPSVVATVESYVKLAQRASGVEPDRLAALSERIGHFRDVVARIDAACVENDLRALEIEVDVLSRQLERGGR